jgi:cell division protein FtsB
MHRTESDSRRSARRATGKLGNLARVPFERIVPALARMKPVTLTLSCMALVALLAMAYLGQVGAVAADNQRLQALRTEQAQLLRQDQVAHARLAQAQDPEYIRRRARELGLVEVTPGTVVVIQVPGLGARSGQAGAGGEP